MLIAKEFNGTLTISGSGTHTGEYFFENKFQPLMSPIRINANNDDTAWNRFMNVDDKGFSASQIQAARDNYISLGWFCYHYADIQ